MFFSSRPFLVLIIQLLCSKTVNLEQCRYINVYSVRTFSFGTYGLQHCINVQENCITVFQCFPFQK